MAEPGGPPSRESTGRLVLCPYCGEVSTDAARCTACRGFFDPLSRQATQNTMGPWFIRDTANPFRPGCSFETLRTLVNRGKVGPDTIVRGPTTNQFWMPARRTPGVANLLGVCHNCGGPAEASEAACRTCRAGFRFPSDRQHLGLIDVRLLPGQAAPEAVAESASGRVNAEAARRGRASAGSVPVWLVALVGGVVLGAVAAAAWLMGIIPGVASPVTGQMRVKESAGVGAENGQSSVLPEAAASGASAVSEAAPPQESEASGPVPDAAAGSRVAKARGLLKSRSEGALREAARLAEEGAREAGAADVRAAAERLIAQSGLGRLP